MTDSPALENEPQYPPDKESWHIYGLIKREWDEIRDIARGEERKRITDILLQEIDSNMAYVAQNDTPWGRDNYPEELANSRYLAERLSWMILVIEGKEKE